MQRTQSGPRNHACNISLLSLLLDNRRTMLRPKTTGDKMHYPARDLPPHDSSDSSCAGFFGLWRVLGWARGAEDEITGD